VSEIRRTVCSLRLSASGGRIETHTTDFTVRFLADPGQKISERSGDRFLFQWISVLKQRLNSILFHHQTFTVQDETDV